MVSKGQSTKRKTVAGRGGSSADVHADGPSMSGLNNAPSKESAFILELRQKHRAPDTTLQKLWKLITLNVFRVDYLFGAYFFDWWEVLLVYPVYLVVAVLVLYGAYRQLNRTWDLVTGMLL